MGWAWTKDLKLGGQTPLIEKEKGWGVRPLQHDNNTVKCWGHNFYGQLGLGDSSSRGDNANEMGDYLPAVNLGTGRVAKALTAGNLHTCALLDDNTVKCWGYNGYGQLGQGTTAYLGDNANEMGDYLPAVNLGTGRVAKALTAGDVEAGGSDPFNLAVKYQASFFLLAQRLGNW